MTAAVKHMARKKPGTAGTAAPAQPRNSQLRERFPARPAQPWWPGTAAGRGGNAAAADLAAVPPGRSRPRGRDGGAGRPSCCAGWLRFPGDTWQQRWDASGAEERPGSSWVQLPLDWLRETRPGGLL